MSISEVLVFQKMIQNSVRYQILKGVFLNSRFISMPEHTVGSPFSPSLHCSFHLALWLQVDTASRVFSPRDWPCVGSHFVCHRSAWDSFLLCFLNKAQWVRPGCTQMSHHRSLPLAWAARRCPDWDARVSSHMSLGIGSWAFTCRLSVALISLFWPAFFQSTGVCFRF